MISDLMDSFSAMSFSRTLNLIAIAWLISAVLPIACSAEKASNYQDLSGDFGRTWLNNFLAQNPRSAENNSSNPWDWAGPPKGSKIVNGKLLPVTNYNQTWEDSYHDWLGDTYLDPGTGNRIYSYIDPNTGLPAYYYIDPQTGKQIKVNANSAIGETPNSVLPIAQSEGSNYPELPPIFGGTNPWT
jgi:hypothetical protein